MFIRLISLRYMTVFKLKNYGLKVTIEWSKWRETVLARHFLIFI